MRRTEFEAIVVGLGGIGSAAACWLARRYGDRVLGLERFELGHRHGASHDHSRIIRLSYHRPHYVRLAAQAYDAWASVEAEWGSPLIVRTGGLDVWPTTATEIPMADYTAAMDASAVPYERLDGSEVRRRWPQWHVDDDTVALYQAESGIAPPILANEAHRALAVRHGATLLAETPVTALRSTGSGVEVDAAGRTFGARRVILCADAWTNELTAPLGTTLPLTVTREQVTYWASPRLADFAADRFPVWIWMDVPSFYGFPVFGEPGPKAAEDVGGRPTTPATRDFEPDPDALARLEAFMGAHLPGALGPVIATRTCLYTLTPDRDFVIDALPGHPDVTVMLGAAHGFKFASLFGRIATELVADGKSEADLAPFRIDRPILLDPNPPTSFMV
ncbi:MAG TPA: N-methyl-L-tryptophan oxidase [Candidatus Limnocylindrales bacterium]